MNLFNKPSKTSPVLGTLRQSSAVKFAKHSGSGTSFSFGGKLEKGLESTWLSFIKQIFMNWAYSFLKVTVFNVSLTMGTNLRIHSTHLTRSILYTYIYVKISAVYYTEIGSEILTVRILQFHRHVKHVWDCRFSLLFVLQFLLCHSKLIMGNF